MPRKFDLRPLHLKIRLRAPKGASAADVVRVVKKAASTGVLEVGYSLAWLDWEKGQGWRVSSGRIEPPWVVVALENFWAALQSARNVRAARVKKQPAPEVFGL